MSKDNLTQNSNTSKHNQTNRSQNNSQGTKQAEEFCSIHRRRLEIFCFEKTCKTKICTNCALFGMHRGHNIKSLEDVYKYANEKSEE